MKRAMTKESLERLYLIEKKTVREIADFYECDDPRIRRYMKKFSIPCRPRSESQRLRFAKTPKPDMNEVVSLYFDEFLSLKDISARTGFSAPTIGRYLVKNGYTLRTSRDYPSQTKVQFNEEHLREMKHLYLNEFWSLVELGNRFGCSAPTINRRLRSFNVAIRSASEARRIQYKKKKIAREKALPAPENAETIPPTPENVRQLRVDENMLIDDIAVRVGLSNLEVYTILQEAS